MSALALVGLVNREGVDTTAAFGVAMQLWTYVQMPAMALGAAVSAMAAQNIGAGMWDRVGRITRVGIVQALVITGALIVAADARRPAGARACSWAATARRCRSPGTSTCVATWNFLLFGVMMVLFGTVRANGAVWAPLIILAIGLVPVRFGYIFATYDWLGADAIWTSFPVTSFDQPRAGGRLLPARRLEEGADDASMTRPDEDECIEEALATREPGGALNPAGWSSCERRSAKLASLRGHDAIGAHMSASFPALRMRRGRSSPWMRAMLAEHRLHPSDFIWPLFICDGRDCEEPIGSLPGVSRWSVDRIAAKAREAAEPRHPVHRAVPEHARASCAPSAPRKRSTATISSAARSRRSRMRCRRSAC